MNERDREAIEEMVERHNAELLEDEEPMTFELMAEVMVRRFTL